MQLVGESHYRQRKSNKETSLWDEANDWDGYASPPQSAPMKATCFAGCSRSFRPKGRGLKPARKFDKDKHLPLTQSLIELLKGSNLDVEDYKQYLEDKYL
jgi:hypothetical protein